MAWQGMAWHGMAWHGRAGKDSKIAGKLYELFKALCLRWSYTLCCSCLVLCSRILLSSLLIVPKHLIFFSKFC